jgi:hypothetical protein
VENPSVFFVLADGGTLTDGRCGIRVKSEVLRQNCGTVCIPERKPRTAKMKGKHVICKAEGIKSLDHSHIFVFKYFHYLALKIGPYAF